MKTVIIDDESKAREALRKLLDKFCPDLQVVAEAGSVEAGVGQIQKHAPELVFLDIRLKEKNGFELLDHFNAPAFKVVFVTAYDHFAVKAFKYNALDYILKPIDPFELQDAVKKAYSGELLARQQITRFMQSLQEKKLETLTVCSHDEIVVIKLDEIIYCKSSGGYTEIHVMDKRKVISSRALKYYVELLPSDRFYRIHQSYLINLQQLSKFVKEDGGYAEMSNGDQLEVSRRNKEAFLARLNRL